MSKEQARSRTRRVHGESPCVHIRHDRDRLVRVLSHRRRRQDVCFVQDRAAPEAMHQIGELVRLVGHLGRDDHELWQRAGRLERIILTGWVDGTHMGGGDIHK